MEYYFSKILSTDFESARIQVIDVLKTEGFGVLTEIDMQAKLKDKLCVDYKKYMILGACNPAFAYKALQAEEKAGVMLPCNILVIDKENGTTEIVAVNPIASMLAIQNTAMESLALEVTNKLLNVMALLK
jgi:uncharacterized protein (DUF302 family)